jgi:hypothetical protein
MTACQKTMRDMKFVDNEMSEVEAAPVALFLAVVS